MAPQNAAAMESPRRLRQRAGRRASSLLLCAVGLLPAALSRWGSVNPESMQAASFKQLPVKFLGATASSDDALAGPGGASNGASVQMGMGPGVMKLTLKDPPSGDAARSAEVTYDTPVPHVGNVGLGVTSGGAWATSWNREIPDVGTVKATLNSKQQWSGEADAKVGDVGIKAKLNSEMEWSADANAKVGDIGTVNAKLNSQSEWSANAKTKVATFGNLLTSVNSEKEWSADWEVPVQAKFGVSPALTLGATEAGLRVKATAARNLARDVSGVYQVRNAPGNYALGDLIQDASITYTGAPVSVKADATLDSSLKSGYKASLTASTQTGAGKLSATADLDRLKMAADTEFGTLSAAIPYDGEEEKVFGLKVGHVTTEAKLKGSEKPRVRVEVTA